MFADWKMFAIWEKMETNLKNGNDFKNVHIFVQNVCNLEIVHDYIKKCAQFWEKMVMISKNGQKSWKIK